MESFKILWKKSAIKDLEKIPSKIVRRIIEIVESLSENPFPRGVRKIIGTENFFRIRVGDYRIMVLWDNLCDWNLFFFLSVLIIFWTC